MYDKGSWLRGLRATRAYTADPVIEEDLTLILEAGRWTGSSLNSQPWTFLVVTDLELRVQLSETGRFSTHLDSAPLVVVLVGMPGRGEFDIGRVGQNMMLAADSLGIGSCPATLHNQDAVRRLLGIPDDHLARHAIAFGYPDEDLEPTIRKNMSTVTERSRKPLEDLVRWERFS